MRSFIGSIFLAFSLCACGAETGSSFANTSDAGKGGGAGSYGTGGQAGTLVSTLPDGSPDGPLCQRTVNLATVPVAKPEPFDVVIVADNSDSVSWSRASLASGLKTLLANVHGSEARFF